MGNKNKNQMLTAKQKEQRTTIILCVVATVLIIAAVVAVIFAMGGFSSTGEEPDTTTPTSTVDMTLIQKEIGSKEISDFVETNETTEYVKITVKDKGEMVVRLRADIAPITVANFQGLVGQKFYDGLTFHRVIKSFMIQGGDPKGDGTGNSDKKIKGEFTANGITNNLKHVRGVISMARAGYSMDSASCQFFICHADATFLDGDYASFGYVVAGMDTVDSVADVEVKANSSGEKSSPVEPVVIEKICFVTEKQS